MENIRNSGVNSAVSSFTPVRRVSESTPVKQVENSDSVSRETLQLSSLAKQLSAAAERAAARDASLSRKELAAFASQVLNKIMGDTYNLAKRFYDSQLPETDDPDLLERARQANAFAMGKGANPFKGLSREQLSLITYDESGAFTMNERRAAAVESSDQHEAWARYIIDKMGVETRLTGRSDQGHLEALDFYNSLPAVEVAQYGNYEADIMMLLSMHEVEWPEFNTSLLDMLANEWKPVEAQARPELPDPLTSPDDEAAS